MATSALQSAGLKCTFHKIFLSETGSVYPASARFRRWSSEKGRDEGSKRSTQEANCIFCALARQAFDQKMIKNH
jgi:hypothetical protein